MANKTPSEAEKKRGRYVRTEYLQDLQAGGFRVFAVPYSHGVDIYRVSKGGTDQIHLEWDRFEEILVDCPGTQDICKWVVRYSL
jgi:hypothetical protein